MFFCPVEGRAVLDLVPRNAIRKKKKVYFGNPEMIRMHHSRIDLRELGHLSPGNALRADPGITGCNTASF